MTLSCRMVSIAMVTAMLGCGPDGAFKVNEEDGGGGDAEGTNPGPDQTPPATEGDSPKTLDAKTILTNEMHATIKDALRICKKQSGKTVTQELEFARPEGVCAWGQDGNLSKRDQFVRARREQYSRLNIPDDAILCEMEFNFPEQRMRYDDEIFLLLNGIVLASSQDYSRGAVFEDGSHQGETIFPDGLEKVGDFVIYDWSKLQNSTYYQNYSPQYCLGEGLGQGECEIPPTETDGRIELSLSPQLTTRVGLLGRVKSTAGDADSDVVEAITRAPKNKLGWVTTGDDNSSDCQHLGVTFEVKLRYVRGVR